MTGLRPSAPPLALMEPYDPKYIPADVMLSANENTANVPEEILRTVHSALRHTALNRYPDPLANDLRALIAEANGLDPESVLMGHGGDELLFDIALAWGGPDRCYLNFPPTFSVYEYNAKLTNTAVVNVPRREDFSIDVDAALKYLESGSVDFTIITSPNNPSGNLADISEVERLAKASDALVVVDEAYFEFSRSTVRPLLETLENVCILRTFSKAFSLAGVRLGYLMGNPAIITELKKVRQPYSVDILAQTVGRVVYENRAAFEKGIDAILEGRDQLMTAMEAMEGVQPFPSESNYILFKLDEGIDAAALWQFMLDEGVLVRDFSRTPGLENCLRVSVGNKEENNRFLQALKDGLKLCRLRA